MAQMQRTRHVGGWHGDHKCLGIGRSDLGLEPALFLPPLIEALFGLGKIEVLRHVFKHTILSPLVNTISAVRGARITNALSPRTARDEGREKAFRGTTLIQPSCDGP